MHQNASLLEWRLRDYATERVNILVNKNMHINSFVLLWICICAHIILFSLRYLIIKTLNINFQFDCGIFILGLVWCVIKDIIILFGMSNLGWWWKTIYFFKFIIIDNYLKPSYCKIVLSVSALTSRNYLRNSSAVTLIF